MPGNREWQNQRKRNNNQLPDGVRRSECADAVSGTRLTRRNAFFDRRGRHTSLYSFKVISEKDHICGSSLYSPPAKGGVRRAGGSVRQFEPPRRCAPPLLIQGEESILTHTRLSGIAFARNHLIVPHVNLTLLSTGQQHKRQPSGASIRRYNGRRPSHKSLHHDAPAHPQRQRRQRNRVGFAHARRAGPGRCCS
jgi:hypothetical protein